MGLPPLQPRIPQCPLVTCGMRLKAGEGEKVVPSPNFLGSWHPQGFKAPLAHSSGLGPLVPPEFPAETLVKAQVCVNRGPQTTEGETTLRDARRHLPLQPSDFHPFRRKPAPGV